MNVARFIDHSFLKVNITENNDCDWSISKQLLEKKQSRLVDRYGMARIFCYDESELSDD